MSGSSILEKPLPTMATANPIRKPEAIIISGRQVEFTPQADARKLKTLEVGHVLDPVDRLFPIVPIDDQSDGLFYDFVSTGSLSEAAKRVPILSLSANYPNREIRLVRNPNVGPNEINIYRVTVDQQGNIVRVLIDPAAEPMVVHKTFLKPNEQTEFDLILEEAGEYYHIQGSTSNSSYARGNETQYMSVNSSIVRISEPRVL